MATRLSAADALSLSAQNSKTPGHTVLVVMIEASDQLDHQRLQKFVAASLPQLARFRSRLVTKPLGLGQPVWAEIDDYDPSPQIHSATIRVPGGRREFADFIADLSCASMDVPEWLWEAWTIDGLEGDRWALAIKISPPLNDGAAAASAVWSRLLSTGPHAASANRLPPEPSVGPAPSRRALVADMMSEMLENQFSVMSLVADTVSDVLQTMSDRVQRTPIQNRKISPVSSTSGPVPRTVFNEPLTNRRAVAFASVPLADATAVSNAFGGSLTNVVLAACTLSLRAWLQRYDKVPDEPLLMRMPFELPHTARPKAGKNFAIGQLRIPVHLDDPVQVLANLHTATENLNTIRKGRHESYSPASDLAMLISVVPPAAARAGMQLYERSGLRHQLSPICHGTVSYTAVEPASAYCAGAQVVGIHTMAPLAPESGLSISLNSRGEQLDLSVCACPDNVPVVDDIATGIVDAVDLLVAAAQKSPRGQGRSVVTDMAAHPANRSRGNS